MNYNVTIEDGVMKAKIAERSFSLIWMHRKPRGRPVESKPGLYILVDDRGYCCYVGETKNFKERMARHESEDKFCWWKHSIFFWDEHPSSAFASTDDREWYEKRLKEIVAKKHPTFMKKVHNPPSPASGEEVLRAIVSLLDVIGFERGELTAPTVIGQPERQVRIEQSSSQGRTSEPLPHKNHRPPLGSWPNYTALAHAIAEANGKPSTAGGIHQKLTNFWAPGRGRYSKANSETRTMLESYGIVFDREGFVKSCANVPFPLRRQ